MSLVPITNDGKFSSNHITMTDIPPFININEHVININHIVRITKSIESDGKIKIVYYLTGQTDNLINITFEKENEADAIKLFNLIKLTFCKVL